MEIKANELLNDFLQSNLGFIETSIIERIELDYARQAALNVLGKLRETVDVITDEDPNNKAQLQLVWGHFLADAGLAESLRSALLDATSKIENENLREALAYLTEPVVKTVVAVNDAELNNGEQLQTIWVDALRDDRALAILEKNLEAILSKIINNTAVVGLLVSLIRMFIKTR